ncbi:MAG: DUF72 domain-containing protein [Chloroflexi bacterium]|nr:DUF72 domain-containing protein [Chloroflexota bacterium]
MTRLEPFLERMPPDMPAAFEFRHPSWHDEETFAALAGRGVGLYITDSDDERLGTTPLVATATRVYFRLRRDSYDDESYKVWAARVSAWVAEGRDVFALLKHDIGLPGIEMGLELTRNLAADGALALPIAAPA